MKESDMNRKETNGEEKKEGKRRKPLIAAAAASVLAVLAVIVFLLIPFINRNRYVGKYSSEEKSRLESIKGGDIFTFGEYEQDNDLSDGKEKIEWIVLERDGNSLLLISKMALDTVPYNKNDEATTWDKCSLRQWLNNEFISEAFSPEEQKLITKTKIPAEKSPKYSTEAGKDTKDRVSILSVGEVSKYFTGDEERKCVPTDYAVSRGAFTSLKYSVDGKPACWWWTRCPGDIDRCVAYVNDDGAFVLFGDFAYYTCDCVRPVIRIHL